MTVQSWPTIYFLKLYLVLIVESIMNEVSHVEEQKFLALGKGEKGGNNPAFPDREYYAARIISPFQYC